MKWRTEIPISKSEHSITHSDFILLLGSCFSVNIDKKLRYHGFGSICNPSGILYNSHSIANMLKLLLGKEVIDKNLFVVRDGMVCHYDFHSDFRAKSEGEFMEVLGQAQKVFQDKWSKVSHLFVTLGSAHVYDYQGATVANCHKQKAELFSKRIQPIDEIKDDLHQIGLLAEAKKVIFTVSPVRHLKDGFIDNQLSKSHLIAAVHGSKVDYFPAYEIIIDDLRDYRFYGKDRVHPSEEAVEYVWEKFSESYFLENTKAITKRVKKIRKMQEHRAFNMESEQNMGFQAKLGKQLEDMRKELPYLL